MLIYNFDQFIVESSKSGFPFHISEVLVQILSQIEDPIVDELLHLNRIKEFRDYTTIDTEFKDDYVTFVSADVLRGSVYTNFDDDALRKRFAYRPMTPSANAWWKGRNPIKIGRLINNIFPDKFTSQQVETFVNKFKAKNKKIPSRFELWNSVMSAYDTSNYSNKYGEANQLWNSCMNDAGDVLELYSNNDQIVECLVLLEEEIGNNGQLVDKIIGRALIWRTTEGDLFMDRAYYIHDKDYYSFIDYAKENNIMYKSINQSGENTTFIRDGVEQWYKIDIQIKYSIFNYETLPYLDTFCFAQGNKLMNYRPKIERYLRLNGTSGDFEIWEEDEY